MTAPEPHPFWCTRQGCGTRGWHTSHTLVVNGGDGGTVAHARLVQLIAADVANVVLTGPDDDDRAALLFTIRQARILRRFLWRLTQEAER